MSYSIEFHPDFFKDMKKMSKSEKEGIAKKIFQILKSPERFKRLKEKGNC